MARKAACKNSRGWDMLAPWLSCAKSDQDTEWNTSTLPSHDDIINYVAWCVLF